MASGVQMQWGPVTFTQTKAAYNKLNRSSEYRWGTVGRMGKERRPAKQFIGPGDDKITLTGVIFPTYAPGGSPVGTKQLDVMRGEGEKGNIHMLMDGRGTVYGKYVLVDIREEQSVIIDTGGFRRQGFTLSFERYGED